MKFSAMNTREQARMLCKIAPAVSRIGKDEELNTKLEEMAKEDKEKHGKTVLARASAMIDAFVPMLLEKHYEDTIYIAGELIGKTDDELERMGIISIVREVKGVVDEELVRFFRQSAATEANE